MWETACAPPFHHNFILTTLAVMVVDGPLFPIDNRTSIKSKPTDLLQLKKHNY